MGRLPTDQQVTLTTHDEVKAALASEAMVRSIDPERFEQGNIMERVILMLMGEDHRNRRRAENALFRRDRLVEYETVRFPPLLHQTVNDLAGGGSVDLIDLGAMLSVVLSGETAGIDFDASSLDVRRHLVDYLHVFARGEAIDAILGNIDTVKADVQAALAEFRAGYFEPSRERRLRLLATRPDQAPADVLTVLLGAREDLDLDEDTILRETAFFFEAGAHTSTQTFTNSIHYVLEWIENAPERRERLSEDIALVQRCVHEALRLRPTNPAVLRRALRDVEICGRAIPAGTVVTLDTARANRDPSAFGEEPESFNPDREVPPSQARYGHSFGGGIHACIGRNLAVGLPIRVKELPSDHLFGLVPQMVQHMVRRQVRRDPTNVPAPDQGTRRWTRWLKYPVLVAT